MTATPEVVSGYPELWQQLAEQIAPGINRFEMDYGRQVSDRLELSLFTSPPQMVLIGRWDSKAGRTVYRPQVTVDGRLALAVRSGRVVGIEGPEFTGPREEWTNQSGQRIWVDMWDCKDEGAYPRAARYLIHVAGWQVPVNGTAPWLEFCQRDSKGKLAPLWQRMPTTMLAKTALSLGLRRSGIENLPADIPVDYEGDGIDERPILVVPPGAAPAETPPVPGRGGTIEHVVVGASRRDGVLQCSCGAQFPTAWAFAVHKKDPIHGDQPPEQVYDDSPESRGYDEDLQPTSYEDPGRPFDGDDQ